MNMQYELMRFKLDLKSARFLSCVPCGNQEFDSSPDKTFAKAGKAQDFLFYECPNCPGAGFWTHRSLINEQRQIARAVAYSNPYQGGNIDTNAYRR